MEQLIARSSWCQLSERVQEPVGQDSEQQDGFLYGLIVRVTLWLYSARTVMSHSTYQRQEQQMLLSFQLVYSRTMWAISIKYLIDISKSVILCTHNAKLVWCGMGKGFAPTWLRQVSPPPASHDHFNHRYSLDSFLSQQAYLQSGQNQAIILDVPLSSLSPCRVTLNSLIVINHWESFFYGRTLSDASMLYFADVFFLHIFFMAALVGQTAERIFTKLSHVVDIRCCLRTY